MTYEELLIEADDNQLIIKEKDLRSSKGRIKGNRIAIRHGMTECEKACVLAEELGHHYTTTGNILDQSIADNRKQKLRARAIAYNKLIGLRSIVETYNHHCQSSSDVAEYLEVTEEFLNDTLIYYKDKYGLCTSIDNYVIMFEPSIAVLEFA